MNRAFGKHSRLLVITLTRLGQPDSFATAPAAARFEEKAVN
jgi:hypothetical protein